MTTMIPLSVRMGSKTEFAGPDECWEWIGARTEDGYGSIYFSPPRTTRRAHVVAWELASGISVPAGLHVLHTCDNPPCVNPRHLKLGTNADNVRDRCDRGRTRVPRGEEQHLSKLTDEDVVEMRALYATGEWSHRRLAARYGITHTNVGYIVRRHTWTHIP